MPGVYRFELKQSIGLPPTPVVRPGDRVARGQLLARAPEKGLGAPLHSSVSGEVVSVTETAVSVRDDGTDFSAFAPLTGETPRERLAQSGLVGLGGAGFPTAAKLNADLRDGGTVVVNAAECEPILAHNIARIETEAAALWDALSLAMELTGAPRGVVALKKRHAAAVCVLRDARTDVRHRVAVLDDLYPTGEERAVVREVLGTLLPPDALPLAAGAVVINAETAYRLREALRFGKPLIDKDVTVAGKLTDNGGVHVLRDVPLGMPLAGVFGRAGGLGPEYGELLVGGPYTGRRALPDEVLLKTTGGLIAAECFPRTPGRLGLLVCACGADETRMQELAESLGGEVVGAVRCKQAVPAGRALKCENPGRCPGQIGRVLELKKAGAQALLIGSCTDCTNTVMSCAPRLGLPIYHITDQALRAVNHPLIRRFPAAHE